MRPLSIVLTLACAPASRAQSVYVDFGPADGGSGVAPASYGGPAVAPGTWNHVGAATAAALLASDGAATGISLTIEYEPAGPVFGTDDVASGEHEPLLDDFLNGDSIFGWIEFAGLASGEYRVHTVDVETTLGFPVGIGVAGSPDPMQSLDGVWTGTYVHAAASGLAAGNYARHAKLVLDGTLRITIGAFGEGDPPHVRGVQVVRIDEHAAASCFGDGGGAACPCGNTGATGRGCASSANAAGGRLYATGRASTGSLSLHGEGLPPGALAILLQGDAVVTPVVFGDGLRCAGGLLTRLYVADASDGLVHAPGPGEPSIAFRSAALGDPIGPGERRWYQIYYRDADAAFCPEPPGAGFNATNALGISW